MGDPTRTSLLFGAALLMIFGAFGNTLVLVMCGSERRPVADRLPSPDRCYDGAAEGGDAQKHAETTAI